MAKIPPGQRLGDRYDVWIRGNECSLFLAIWTSEVLNHAMSRSQARHLMRYLLVLCMLVVNVGHGRASPLPRPTLGKAFIQCLLDQESRSDAFYELVLRVEENDVQPRWKGVPRSLFDDAMRDIRITECPGRDGNAPLYLVTYREDFEKWYAATHPKEHALQNGFEPEDFYPPAPQETRLKTQKGISHLDRHLVNEPMWRPDLDGKVLLFIDSNGQVQWPHGGSNLGHIGTIIADINGDGVLERIDHENYGFDGPDDKDIKFQMLEIKTIEATPRLLLTVVFNWHPNAADPANRWWFDVKYRAGEPFPVIELGPQPGEHEGAPIEKATVEYHWDQADGRYIGPEGKPGDHFRRLSITTMDGKWPKIKALQKEKGLGYPLLKDAPSAKTESSKKEGRAFSPGAWKQWPKYEHHSLAAMSNEDLFRWQYGGEPEQNDTHIAWPAVVIPPKLRQLPPRDAALALAEANRTRAHRKQYDLVVADEGKLIPKDGVLMLDVHPGWSSPYTEFIRLKAENAEWWRYGVLDHPQWSHFLDADGMLRWLAETIAWLDRVRTVPHYPEVAENASRWSYCDTTQVGLTWQANRDDEPPITYRITEPQFAGRQWKGPYTRLVAQTLAVNLWASLSEGWTETRRAERIPEEKAFEALIPAKPDAIARGDL
ncbi:MAG: hypothetical protein ACFUZC_12390 [Chthoniobacteraceae bacterium]